jgi:hypothetical protein
MDNSLVENKNIRAKPPGKAYLYFPKGNEIIEINHNNIKHSIRKVFDIAEENYTDFEREQLLVFRHEYESYSQKNNITIPSHIKTCDILRFLQATSYNIDKSLDLIKQYVIWYSGFFPMKITNKTLELLNSGFIYGHGRDNRYRPIFVISAETYMRLRKDYRYEEWLTAVIYFIEYIVNNMLIPGQIEDWTIIADLNNVSIMSIPSELINMFGVLQSNYRCRLNKIYILNMSTVLNFLWNIVKNWINPTTFNKIRFVKHYNEIKETINPEQIEKKYGGLAEDKKDNYFPPTIPSDNFLLLNEREEDILIPEDEYKVLVNSGKLTTVSPAFKSDARSVYSVAYTVNQPNFTIVKCESNINLIQLNLYTRVLFLSMN